MELGVWSLYGGFWMVVAVYSAVEAISRDDRRLWALTATASLNLLIYGLTGRTRGRFKRDLIGVLRSTIGYLASAAVAIAGFWMVARYDAPSLAVPVAFLALVGFILTWLST